VHPYSYGDKYDGDDEPTPQQVIKELYDQVKQRIDDIIVTTGVGQHKCGQLSFFDGGSRGLS